jgi:hypothetical protein
MSPSQLQILANLVYLLYSNSIAEWQIKKFSTPVARLQQLIRTSIDTYQDPTKDVATLKTLIERLSYVVSTRTIYMQTLNTCITHYNKNFTPEMSAAVEHLRAHAEVTLRAWADAKSEETAQQLKKCADTVSNSLEHFQGVARLHSGISNGLMPIQITPEEEIDKSLIILSIVLKNTPELLTVTENVALALLETTDHTAQIIQAGAEIYREFYATIYNMLISSCDKQYTTTLFSMHGLLPDEYKSVLPHPDHVFEHMLQTAKLYTQTEYLQPQ